MGMMEWGQNLKRKKKFLDQKLTPKKSDAEFLSLKNFQKALNDTKRKMKTLDIEFFSVFIHHTILNYLFRIW